MATLAKKVKIVGALKGEIVVYNGKDFSAVDRTGAVRQCYGPAGGRKVGPTNRAQDVALARMGL